MKVQAHSPLEPPQEYTQYQTTLMNVLGAAEILSSFTLVLEGKTGKEIPEALRLEFLDKFLANNFPLSNAEVLF